MGCNSILHAESSVTKTARPLNILFVVGNFPAPSQIFILNIITGLIDKGHNVSIFSFRKGNHTSVHPNIKKYKLLDRVTYGNFPYHVRNCDIVFCQFGYLGKKVFRLKKFAKWLKKKKVVVCFRGADITSHIKHDPNMYKQLFVQADLFLPVCDYFKKRLIALGCDSKKIIVHHSAIDCKQFFFRTQEKPSDRLIQIVSVCRLVKKKGIDHAIKAIALIAEKYPNIHFTIVGEGPERTYFELLIRQLKLQDKVTMCGWKSQDQVVSILDKSHIFILPSRVASDGNEEGIANAIKEAMSMGLISIATWHAGTPELIEDGKSGFLVPEKSPSRLAKAIEYIIEHPEKWKAIGIAARKKVEEEFETKKCIERLEKIFYSLVGR